MDLINASILFILPLLLIYFFFFILPAKPSSSIVKLPKSYPVIGYFPAMFMNRKRPVQWTCDLIKLSPATATLVVDFPFGHKGVLTGNPAVIQHILKTNFVNYPKGNFLTSVLRDLVGDGIFNSDGRSWKFQRQDMVYTHASLCESMRLYPPLPIDGKEAANDDVLPDDTMVKKGMIVMYHPYAMGRLEELWGPDWEEFKPERWLAAGADGEKWVFVGRDSFTYSVFQAGPRICIGKEMAFLQMKRVVAGVLSRFEVIPVVKDGVEPKYISFLTSKMHGGFAVRIQDRI